MLVTFAQLSKIEGFNGDFDYGYSDKNIFLWFGMSEEAIKAINELEEEGTIQLETAEPLAYLIDGIVPGYEIAKQDRKYKSERWLPTCIKILKN